MKKAILLILLMLVACSTTNMEKTIPDTAKVATFAGGCFWCVESAFEKLDGVYEVVSGYTGGDEPSPTYNQVASGQTNHKEAIQVYYNPEKLSYNDLLDTLWKNIDPTDAFGQFVDKGAQYTTAIYYANDEEKLLAEQSKQALQDSGRFDKPIVTEILPLKEFHRAEEYHQDYHETNPVRYNLYTSGSGRKQFQEKHWQN